MTIRTYLRAFASFCRISPRRVDVAWTRVDAEGLQAYLKTASGRKFSDYSKTYILHQQDAAISNPTNLEFNAGACQGSKAILAQIDALSEPDNFTDEEGSD